MEWFVPREIKCSSQFNAPAERTYFQKKEGKFLDGGSLWVMALDAGFGADSYPHGSDLQAAQGTG